MSVRGRAAASRRLPTSIPRARRSRRWSAPWSNAASPLTSTLTVFELNTPGRPLPPGLDVLVPQLREQYLQNRARVEANAQSIYPRLFPKAMALEREFVARRRPAHRRHRSHRRRRRHPRLCEPPAARAAGRSRVHAARGDPDRHAERRPLPRARRPRRLDRAGQAGRPRGGGRRSLGGDRRRPEGDDGVQAGCGLRPGEAGGVGDGTGRAMVNARGPGTGDSGTRDRRASC